MKIEKNVELEKLFTCYSGWTGADGVYTYQLDDGNLLWYFSDTFIGEVDPITGKRQDGYQLINNTLAYTNRILPFNQIDFIMNEKKNLFQPNKPQAIYWLQDGVILNDHLYIYAIVVESNISHNPFDVTQVDLLKIPIRNNRLQYPEYQRFVSPLCFKTAEKHFAIFGAATYLCEDYLYVYGYLIKEDKKLIIARVKPNKITDFSSYQYLSNNQFNEQNEELDCLLDDIAAEFSVTRNNDHYEMIYTKGSIGRDIYRAKLKTPYSNVFSNQMIFHVKDAFSSENAIIYNAKIVRGFLPEKRIISYHVNTTVDHEHIDANLYRPRFIEIKEDNG